MPISISELSEAVRQRAKEEGFDVVRLAKAVAPPHATERLSEFLEAGRHGEMEWLAKNAEKRADPSVLWPEAKSIIVLGVNYGPDHDPRDDLGDKTRGAISVYARGDDYHDVIKKKLKSFAGHLCATYGGDAKVFVDTAPVLEKAIAEQSGMGWQGKHTNLVSRDYGSWLFLGSVFTTLELEADEPHLTHCGQCRACLDACPTEAFLSPFRMDARRCVSYLTIENKGPIPAEFRIAIGNRIYGCDDCLSACPWNKFAQTSQEAQFAACAITQQPKLADLARLDDAEFRTLFRASPIKRIGRDRFIRNVLIAIGNSGDQTLAAEAERLLTDASPLVRGMAVWALSRLRSNFESLRARHRPSETDPAVLEEWDRV
ncbi:epoxyqueuosine reductase [Rhizomicrobium palustre]|uniref:Epoxyqueuosine reductase n=1 Tax=Rhizomicrobium palustre TaxID=189966 RepID=A0A846MTM0_9PROT|nr:tRNA epoxyqueuosine(34) reductase QueG [Rhizomicrobium palustre]NIK86848.1 epoxyqueuosine reductase [Rhizomicrobium palustre]